MIVSHKHRFIFIKTKKTAGTSIEAFLSRHCAQYDVVTPIHPPEPGHIPRNYGGYYNHISAHQVRAAVGEHIWNEYLTFCVERSPWEKFISYYYMLRNSPYHGEYKALNMDEYIERGPYPLNYPIYMDKAHREVIVQTVIRYENLASELTTFLGRLGLPFDGDLGYRAKGNWRTDRRPYWEILSPDQIRRISDLAAKEIELHGYQPRPT